jgi:hypothetical protein
VNAQAPPSPTVVQLLLTHKILLSCSLKTKENVLMSVISSNFSLKDNAVPEYSDAIGAIAVDPERSRAEDGESDDSWILIIFEAAIRNGNYPPHLVGSLNNELLKMMDLVIEYSESCL